MVTERIETMYRGWIGAAAFDEEHLRSLGVRVGAYDCKRHTFEASMSEGGLKALTRFAGIYNWGLVPGGESRQWL